MSTRAGKQIKTQLKKETTKKTKGIKETPSTYRNFLYGALSVIFLIMVFFGFLRMNSQNVKNNIADEGLKISQDKEADKNKKSVKNEHIITEGETLWSISEKFYKSGFNWIDIARANNISNPDILYKGMKIVIPEINQDSQTNLAFNVLSAESDSNRIDGKQYEVQEGDNLWEIAERAYGDGYKWIEISKANNLESPDLIHSGNKFVIPR